MVASALPLLAAGSLGLNIVGALSDSDDIDEPEFTPSPIPEEDEDALNLAATLEEERRKRRRDTQSLQVDPATQTGEAESGLQLT